MRRYFVLGGRGWHRGRRGFRAAERRRPAQADAWRGTIQPPPRASQLPIGQVVLFSSGVGYFQREGVVEGNRPRRSVLPGGGHQRPAQVDGAARPGRRPHRHRLLRQQRAGREDSEVVRHQPERQSVLWGHPQPGARREGRGRHAAGQRRPAGDHDGHRGRRRTAEAASWARMPRSRSSCSTCGARTAFARSR